MDKNTKASANTSFFGKELSSKTLWLILLIILVAFVVVTQSRPRQIRESTKRALCRANLWAIGQALQLYADDHDGRFPANFQALVDAGHCRVKVFRCLGGSGTAGASSYEYVSGLDTKAEGDWIVVYEDPADHLGQGALVLFIDGHTEFLDAEKLDAELRRVQAAIEESPYAGRPEYQTHLWRLKERTPDDVLSNDASP